MSEKRSEVQITVDEETQDNIVENKVYAKAPGSILLVTKIKGFFIGIKNLIIYIVTTIKMPMKDLDTKGKIIKGVLVTIFVIGIIYLTIVIIAGVLIIAVIFSALDSGDDFTLTDKYGNKVRGRFK